MENNAQKAKLVELMAETLYGSEMHGSWCWAYQSNEDWKNSFRNKAERVYNALLSAGALVQGGGDSAEPVKQVSEGVPLLCGDHAQYELDNRDTPKEERADWPYPSFDARDWAAAFCKRFPEIDESTMLGWFANALMRGYDHSRTPVAPRTEPDVRELVREYLEADNLVSRIYDEASPGLNTPRPQDHYDRLGKAIERRLAARATLAAYEAATKTEGGANGSMD